MSSKPVKPEAPEKILIDKDDCKGPGGFWYSKWYAKQNADCGMKYVTYIRSDLAKPQASPASALADERWKGTNTKERAEVGAMLAEARRKKAKKAGKKKA